MSIFGRRKTNRLCIIVIITKSYGCSSLSAGPKSWYQYVIIKLYHLLNILPSGREQIALIYILRHVVSLFTAARARGHLMRHSGDYISDHWYVTNAVLTYFHGLPLDVLVTCLTVQGKPYNVLNDVEGCITGPGVRDTY